MAEKPTKWKIQFFDKKAVDDVDGRNLGTFYTFAKDKHEALDKLKLRWQYGDDPKTDRLPTLLGLFNKGELSMQVVPDDGLGPDKTLRDLLTKIGDLKYALQVEEERKQRVKSEEEEKQRSIDRGLCPNCDEDISDTGFCPKCGFNPDNPPRRANWLETRMRKEARLLSKNE
jgi:hypothetical protein